ASGREVTRFPKAGSENDLNPQAWLSADSHYVLTIEEQPDKDTAKTLGMKDSESMLQELSVAVKSGDTAKVNRIRKATDDALIHILTARVYEASTGKELWHYDFQRPNYSELAASFYAYTPSNFDWIFSPDSRYVMLKGIKKIVLLSAADGTIVREFD